MLYNSLLVVYNSCVKVNFPLWGTRIQMKKRVLIYVLTGLLLIYFVGMFISQQIKISEREEKIEALNEEIASIKEESEKLKKEIENAESRETIEAIAREELGLVYPDERKFIESNG